MSFILEALKKSEQQRQKQNVSKSKVRKRTLSLQASRSGRQLFPWLVAVFLLLIVLGGWWLYSQDDATQVMEPSAMGSAPIGPPAVSETAVTAIAVLEPAKSPPAAESVLQQPAVDVEPAPVPKVLGSAPVVAAKATAQRIPAKAPSPQSTEGLAPRKRLVSEASESVISDQAQESSQLPLYNDLSRELRAQMPILDMSMHFYTPEPGRRMVRINDHLLHEGNWVDSNLQLVEVTPTGAILDFLGKSFELRRARR